MTDEIPLALASVGSPYQGEFFNLEVLGRGLGG